MVAGSDAPYADHVGGGNEFKYEMNQTGFRNRGYGTGSIYATWGNDKQYIQPGHALAQQVKGATSAGTWDPAQTEKPELVMTDAAEAHAKARADKAAIAAAQAAEQGSRD